MLTPLRLQALFFAALALVALPGGLMGQTVTHEISLEDGVGAVDFAFGMQLSPDNDALYVAVAGSFGDPNKRLVKIDTATDTYAGEGITGETPKEIAFRLDGSGDIEKIFVTNNGGTVTILNPDLSPSGTLDLTPHGAAYLFGLLMGPGNRYLYVSTVNMGEIFVIDTEPGPTYLDVVYHTISAWNGRMATYQNKLLIPGSDYIQGAVLSIMDMTQPSQVDTVVLSDDFVLYPPSANDVVVTQDGFAYVTLIGSDTTADALLYEVDLDANPPVLSRTIDLAVPNVYKTLEHGICASPDGQTLVVTYLDGAFVKIVGRKAGCVLALVEVDSQYSQVNDVVFTKDGKKVYASSQSSSKVYVIEDVPCHGLLLSGTEEAPLGTQVEFELMGGEASQPGALLLSLTAGPTAFPFFTLDLGIPLMVVLQGFFGADNKLTFPVQTVPNDPSLLNRDYYFQGLTQDGDYWIRPSNLHILKVL